MDVFDIKRVKLVDSMTQQQKDMFCIGMIFHSSLCTSENQSTASESDIAEMLLCKNLIKRNGLEDVLGEVL